MYEKTYCINLGCPFKECDKHLNQIRNVECKDKYVKVAALDSVCRDYIGYLLDEILNG
jgi:hypothetical protein